MYVQEGPPPVCSILCKLYVYFNDYWKMLSWYAYSLLSLLGLLEVGYGPNIDYKRIT
jgi:hypothetical protein